MNQTIDYYNNNAITFIDNTLNVDFKPFQDEFADLLPSDAVVLDFGCGSGRDTKYFLNKGFETDAIDGSEELCKSASEYTGIKVKHMLFQDLNEEDRYHGIWACASILHLSKRELVEVIKKLELAAKVNGVVYMSFKYGDFEGIRDGRYFTDLTEESSKQILANSPGFRIEKMWITNDVRKEKEGEKWLNLLLRKTEI